MDNNHYNTTSRLKNALSHPNLREFFEVSIGAPASISARRSAFAVAVALGNCRLFGGDAGEYDGTLPPYIAVAAAQNLKERLAERFLDRAASMSADWDSADNGFEAEDIVATLLEFRMRAWAVCIALSEAELTPEMATSDCKSEFASQFKKAQDYLLQFDVELKRQTDVLSTVCDLNLLSNWRTMLAEPFSLTPPWWLDGSLESEADECLERSIKAMHSEADLKTMVGGLKTTMSSAQSNVVRVPVWDDILQSANSPAIAADDERLPAPTVHRWKHPDLTWFVELRVPAEANVDAGFTMTLFTEHCPNKPVNIGGRLGKFSADGLFRINSGTVSPKLELTLTVDELHWVYLGCD